MTQHLGTYAAIGWSSTSDTVHQRVHLLAVPLRNAMPGFTRPTYRSESLDRTVIESFTLGSGAHELVGEVRYDDDPESLVEMLHAGAANQTLNYYPDARDATQVIPCKLVAPVGSTLDALVDAQRGTFGNASVTIRLRRTDQAPFTVPYQGRDVLWWYRGGGTLRGYTFARADTATTWGPDGAVATVAAGQARTIWPRYLNVAPQPAVGHPALLLERAGSNLVLQSEDFGTTWTAQGTPTRSAAAKTCGTVVLDLLGDDDGAALEYYHQNITFTGNAVKCISVFWAPGTSIAAGGAGVVLRDTTAGADRLNATIQSSGANVYPSVTCSAGSLVDAWELSDGVWRLAFLTASVTAANTNNLRIQPAAVAAQTGNAYFGGIQAEDSVVPSSYGKTTSAANARTADSLSRAVAFSPRYDTLLRAKTTFYVRFVEAGTFRTTNARVFQLSGTDPVVYVEGSGSFYRAVLTDNLGASATATLGAAPAYGEVVELLVVVDPALGSVTISQSVGGTAPTSASASLAAGFLPATWGTSTLYLNGGPAGGAEGWLWLLNGAIVRGGRDLPAMRRIARV